MMTYQVQVPLGSMPVNLILVGNRVQGRVAFVKVAPIAGAIFDTDKDHNIRAAFYVDRFEFFGLTDEEGDEVFDYDQLYDYKSIPLMLRWLQRQELEEPNVVFG